MTFYEREIRRIRATVYANQGQIDSVIGIRNYIDEHCAADVNLDVLSRERFVSKFHLIRLFKRYYGQTPGQYLIDKRIERSKEHLRDGMNVTNTCFAIGFECPSSFSTLFKSRTGMTPVAFQKRAIFAKESRCGS